MQLPAVTLSALVAHRHRKEQERYRVGSAWRETGFEFTTSIGTPLDARRVIRSFHSILKKAALPRIRFHDLRHSTASLLLAQGVSPKYISDLLGHSQVSFTMDTYAEILDQVRREATAHMDDILNAVGTSVGTKHEQSRLN